MGWQVGRSAAGSLSKGPVAPERRRKVGAAGSRSERDEGGGRERPPAEARGAVGWDSDRAPSSLLSVRVFCLGLFLLRSFVPLFVFVAVFCSFGPQVSHGAGVPRRSPASSAGAREGGNPFSVKSNGEPVGVRPRPCSPGSPIRSPFDPRRSPLNAEAPAPSGLKTLGLSTKTFVHA